MPRDRKPRRIQLSRKKGWRLPDGAVVVARPSKWGNFYRVGQPMCRKTVKRWGYRIRDFANPCHVCADPAEATLRFSAVLAFDQAIWPAIRAELRGRDLACWCPPGQPCHADVLLELANARDDE